MGKIIFGCDPDSDQHGIAIYINGILDALLSMNSLEVFFYLDGLVNCVKGKQEIEFHIEDVCANNSTFKKIGVKNAIANQAVTRGIGKCQQAQIELERVLKHFKIKVVKHKISKMWKKDKAQFEKVTRWKSRSNEDTRSAAWFGYLGSTSKIKRYY